MDIIEKMRLLQRNHKNKIYTSTYAQYMEATIIDMNNMKINGEQ